MIEYLKPVESLTVADLVANPVWQFTNRDGAGETFVRAARRIPVDTLAGKVVGSKVMLANGSQVWVLLGNINVEKPELTLHLLTMSIERDEKWFHLARYHDVSYASHGPAALSAFLDLGVDEIFPISYDLRKLSQGDERALSGCIEKEPRVKLSEEEIIALAVP